MKKICFIFFVAMIIMPFKVSATNKDTKVYFGTNIYECSKLQDGSLGINGIGYFSQCMKATCERKSYSIEKYEGDKKIVCRNGNNNPYWEVVKDGCGKGYGNFYNKTCTTGTINYCTKITKYDCNRKSDGSSFTTTTTTNKTTHTVTVTPSTTTTTTTTAVVNTKLKSLNIENYPIDFKNDNYSYNLTIDSKLSNLVIKAEAENSYAKIDITGNENLVDGSKIIVAVIVNDQKTEYVLNITKEIVVTSTKLKSLTIPGIDSYIYFNSERLTYDITIDDSVTNVEVNAVAEDENALINITGNNDLVDGSVISIVVSDNKDNKTEYKVNVTKKAPLSSNANLSSLSVAEYNINYMPEVKDYNVEIDNKVKYLTVNYEVEDSKATVEIKNNSNLKDGSKVIINVIAEDGTTNSYTINVNLKEQSNFLGILFIIVLIIALGIGGYYVYKKFFSGKKEDKYEYE